MTEKDMLPVLPFERPQTRQSPAAGPRRAEPGKVVPGPRRRTTPPPPAAADPADLARAMAALRAAMDGEMARRPAADPEPRPERETDPCTPVGRPRWRAGRDGDRPDGFDPGRLLARPRGDAAPPAERDPLARRITAIHLPRLAIERWQRRAAARGEAPPDDLPVALATEGTHGPVVHATNRAAEREGVHRGARVVDMRALCPELRVEYADVGGDAMALQRLMLWARRWCPWTAVDGAAGLVMDTTGSDHLWGGEAAMLREIEERLSALGLSCDLATAPTHGAAWALSRFGGVREVCPADGLAPRMAPLPVRSLRITPETALLLKRLGLKTVGELSAVPRLSLARRFSRAALEENPLQRLDQMMGRAAEPVNAPDDPPRFAVEAKLPEPVQDPSPHLPDLARALCDGLAEAGFGARRVTLTIYRTDGEVAEASVALARPTRDPGHIVRLFEGRLDRVDPGFGFDLVTLGATVAEDMTQVQTRLDGGADDAAEMAKLTDRLTARFGARAVKAPALRESHVPERREDWLPAMGLTAPTPPPAPLPRPLRLLDPAEEVRVVYAVPEGPPAQFVWRRVTHRVTRFAGPERIAPEWWRDLPGTRLRDYYRIEDHRGLRVWLYREGVLGDNRGGEPRWFVHGLFG